MLYSDFTATLIPGVLAGLAQPDAADATASEDFSAARIVALFGPRSPASARAHTGQPATYAAVACAEWLSQTRPGAADRPWASFGEAVVGDGLAADCEPWPIASDPLPLEPVRSDLPVLLISGHFDPITPPKFGEAAAQHLSRGTHIVSRTRGHGIWAWGYDSCVDRIVADFLADPAAALDTACASEDRPLRWQPLP